MLNTRVHDVSDTGVTLPDRFLHSATVVWGAGVAVKNVDRWLETPTDRTGRVMVKPDLSMPGHPEVFVIGDAAKVPWKDGRDVPRIAPAAKQDGKYVGKLIARAVRGKPTKKPFRYRHLGNLATIGRHAAVIEMGKVKLSGPIAWWLSGNAHIYFLIGVRQPLMVALSGFRSYLTFSKGARLITGLPPLHEVTTRSPNFRNHLWQRNRAKSVQSTAHSIA